MKNLTQKIVLGLALVLCLVTVGQVALARIYNPVSSSGSSVTSVTGTYPIVSSGGTTPAISVAFGTTTAQSWSLLQQFKNASSTQFSAYQSWFGGTATSTIGTNGFYGFATSTPSEAMTIIGGILSAESQPATTTSMTLDLSTRNQFNVQLGTSATTLTLTGLLAGQGTRVVVCNPGSTASTVTWATTPANSLLWSGGTAPTQTTTANKCDVYTFTTTLATSTTAVKVLGGYVQNF